MLRRTEDLPELRKTRKVTAAFWRAQVDAAAKGDAEDDGGGGALVASASRGKRRRGSGRGKSENRSPLSLFIRQWVDGMRGLAPFWEGH